MTLVTDYVLGTLAEVCALLLLKRNVALRQTSIRLWALALIATATASYAGGTYHGFQQSFSPPVAANVVEGDDDQHGVSELSPAGRSIQRVVCRVRTAVAPCEWLH